MTLIRKHTWACTTIVLMILWLFLSPNALYAQGEYVTMRIKNGTVKTFMKEVEKQTRYTFVYRNAVLNPNARVSIVCTQLAVEQALTQVFGPMNIDYSFSNNTIVLVKKEAVQKAVTDRMQVGAQPPKIKVQGVVRDEREEPVIGATVYLKGVNQGTVTNVDGEFSLEAPENAVLQVSFIGYRPVEIAIEGRSNIQISLKDDVQTIQEVVVVGFGRQKKESVTASISTMATKELVQTPQANISNMLVGRLPGLIAMQRSGAPGEDASMLLIRGVSTFTENTSPLIMIDGVERASFDGIDPNEIETVSILKDASATAIYGVRGANGVILITTRKGAVGAPRISYSGNFAMQKPTALPSYLNSADYATMYNEALKNDSYTTGAVYVPRFTDEDIELYRNGTDPILHPSINWIDDFLAKSSFRTQHNFNISGGTERVRFFVSVGYYDQNGIYKHTKLDKDHDVNPRNTRYNFRSNLDFQISKDFTATMQLAGQMEDVVSPGNGNGSIWREMSYSNPLNSPGWVDGKVVRIQGEFGMDNPWLELLGGGYKKESRNNMNSTFRLNYDLSRVLLKGLTVHGSVSYDSYYQSSKRFSKTFPYYVALRDATDPEKILFIPEEEETIWNVSSESGKNRKVYMEFGINYAQSFGKHKTSALLLYNQSKYFSPALQYFVPNAYQGLVGRLTYEYGSRYLAEFNMGYNGTENFAKGKRFGFFPAVSAGWVISEEPFFPKNDYIVFLKFKGSYGEVGNDKIGGDRFLYLPSSYGEAENEARNRYYFGLSSSPIGSLKIVENKIGNPNLTWEKAKKWNIGMEMNLFDNHLKMSVDLFKEKRNNILANMNTQPVIIGANLPAYNFGEMENKGWEIDMTYRNRINDFHYWGRFNYSFARNKILYMDEIEPRHAYLKGTGRRKNQFFGLLYEGYYNSWEEVNALDRPVSSWSGNKLQPGDLKYVDVNHDGVIDNYDNVPIGYSPIPEVVYGFSLGFEWKGIDVSTLFQGADNVSIKYFGRSMWPFINAHESAKSLILERWTQERYEAGLPINFPRLSMNPNKESDHNYRDSNYWIRDASYLRLKNVEIGYTFGKKTLKKLGIESIRAYVSGSNLFTWTDVIDLDPEAPSKSGNVEIYAYPLQKVYNFGININF